MTARRWGEDEQLYGLSGDEDEAEEEEDDEYYQEQEGEVYYWRNRRVSWADARDGTCCCKSCFVRGQLYMMGL